MNEKQFIFWSLIAIMMVIIFGMCIHYNKYKNNNEEYKIGKLATEDMDYAVLQIQLHCLNDLLNDQKNLEFCDEFVGINETDDSLLKLYKWNN